MWVGERGVLQHFGRRISKLDFVSFLLVFVRP